MLIFRLILRNNRLRCESTTNADTSSSNFAIVPVLTCSNQHLDCLCVENDLCNSTLVTSKHVTDQRLVTFYNVVVERTHVLIPKFYMLFVRAHLEHRESFQIILHFFFEVETFLKNGKLAFAVNHHEHFDVLRDFGIKQLVGPYIVYQSLFRGQVNCAVLISNDCVEISFYIYIHRNVCLYFFALGGFSFGFIRVFSGLLCSIRVFTLHRICCIRCVSGDVASDIIGVYSFRNCRLVAVEQVSCKVVQYLNLSEKDCKDCNNCNDDNRDFRNFLHDDSP